MDADQRRHTQRCPIAAVASERGYARHRSEDTVLYQVVERHVGSFFDSLSEQGASVPGFVREEFDAYLRCGRLKHFSRKKLWGEAKLPKKVYEGEARNVALRFRSVLVRISNRETKDLKTKVLERDSGFKVMVNVDLLFCEPQSIVDGLADMSGSWAV